MKNSLLILSLLIAVNSYCQKELIISENKAGQIFYENLGDKLDQLNLEDLRTAEENSIRIWSQNEILTFGNSALITFYTSQGENTISKTYTFKKNFNLESLQKEISALESLKNNGHRSKIDEYPLTVEISTPERYQLVSGYDNEVLNKFLSDIREQFQLKSFRDRFINQLPRGNYRMGMSIISIDHLLGDSEEKSDFYKKVIQEAKSELQISEKTPATEFPLVIINEKPGNLKNLNSLATAKIESYRILPETTAIKAIYGENGENGVILVTTK